MGFFSSFLAPIIKVGVGVFAGEAAATAIFGGDEPEKQIEAAATAAVGGAPAGTALPLIPRAMPPASSQVAFGGTVAATIPPAAAPAAAVVAPGGLKNVVRTLVQTIAPNGTIIGTQLLQGRPFLMKKDIVAAKRVFKLSSKLHAKLPKRAMKQSEMSKINEAILDETRRRLTGPSCPPKC